VFKSGFIIETSRDHDMSKDCFSTIRDLRVKIAELEKELIPLQELKRIFAGSEVWDCWKKHGGKFNE